MFAVFKEELANKVLFFPHSFSLYLYRVVQKVWSCSCKSMLFMYQLIKFSNDKINRFKIKTAYMSTWIANTGMRLYRHQHVHLMFTQQKLFSSSSLQQILKGLIRLCQQRWQHRVCILETRKGRKVSGRNDIKNTLLHFVKL